MSECNGVHRFLELGKFSGPLSPQAKCSGCGKTAGELGMPLECQHRYSARDADGTIRCDFCREPLKTSGNT